MFRLPKSNKPYDYDEQKDNRDPSKGFREKTQDIEVTVWPEFIDGQSNNIGNIFIWAYQVRIDNKSNKKIKILNRYWKIVDEKGIVQEVSGEGVVGQQPEIMPNSYFKYTSGVHLLNPSGIMSGHYQVQVENGEIFDAKIPAFSLDTPFVNRIVN